MKICLLCAALPPQLDGIGDYTANLAAELACHHDVSIVAPSARNYLPIANVAIHPAFSTARRRDVWQMEGVLRHIRPDWVVLQYNPFSWGHRGLNLSLAALLSAIKKRIGARVAVMIHEAFMTINSWRSAVMSAYQRYQFVRLGKAADLLFFSIAPWAERFAGWFPGKPVHHLPVGSNVPQVSLAGGEARARLSIDADQIVLGIFGTAHESRLFGYVRAAAERVAKEGGRPLLLYIGPHPDRVKPAFAGLPHIAEGPLEPEEISRRFQAMDINLAAYSDGVSSRRTSMIAALQHAIPIVCTRGRNTDAMFLQEDGRSILIAHDQTPQSFADQVATLARDQALRQRIGAGGRELFDSVFSWPVIARKLINCLNEGERA